MKKAGTFYKDSWLWNFYKAAYDRTPNSNFCDYFWALIWAFVALPVTWGMYIVTKVFDDNNCSHSTKFFVGLMLDLILLTVILTFHSNPIMALKVTGIVAGLIGLVFLIIYLVLIFGESAVKENLVRNMDEVFETASTGFTSWKMKYCPQIEWVENPKNVVADEPDPSTNTETN